MTEDTKKRAVEVSHLTINKSPEPEEDAFLVDGDDLKQLTSGNFKRKLSRQINDLEKKYTGADGAESKKQEGNIITGYNAFDVVLPPYNLHTLAKIYEVSSANMSAVDAKVSNIVGLGYEFVPTAGMMSLLEEAADNPKKLKKIRKKTEEMKRYLDETLESFNDEDEFLEILIKVYTDLETTGNAYIEIGRKDVEVKKGERKPIGYLGHCPSAAVRVRRARDGFVQIIANEATFFRNFGDTTTADPINGDSNPNELIHLKIFSPTNNFYGVPKIVSAKQAVAGTKFAQDYNVDYFENKAVPRYIFVSKNATLSKAAQTRLLEFLETGLKGKHHRSIYIPLEADTNDVKSEFEVKPIENGVQDSSFNNYRKSNLADVLMSHRVPINKVSSAEGTNLAVARDADKTFKEQVCRPAQRALEKRLNKIFRELTDMVKIKFNELALSDEDTQSKIDERYARIGTITVNEVRVSRGLPEHPDGDKLIDLKPQQKADMNARTTGNRARDAQRSANSTDNAGEGRSTKGDGRTGGAENSE